MKKLCRHCGKERQLEEFYLRRKGALHRQAYCRDCMRAYNTASRQTKAAK